MTDKPKKSLAKRYFISRSSINPEDYEEFWIRYKPERVARKESGKLPGVLTASSLVLLLLAIILLSFTGFNPITQGAFITWAILFGVSFYLSPNHLLRFVYPTHIQLSEEGIKYHWLRHWIHASSPTIDWERVSHVTTSDKKVFNTLSILVEFNLISRGMSPMAKSIFLMMSPAMSWGWLTSDRPMLKVNINGIASSDDRKRLQLALKKFLPSYRIEPKVADDLNMYIKFDSYTDIWLETLTSSQTRNLETVLTPGTLLSNGTYKVLESIGSGGEALVYKAELLKPIPSVLGLDGVARNETMVDMTDMDIAIDTSVKSVEFSPPVVLKEFVLPSQAGVNARQRVLENIREEAILWRKLRHPNIVRLLDFFAEDQRAYLVLEYLEGKTLKDIVDQGNKISPDKAVDMGLVMCDILGHLHRKKPPVVHRDFTPDNLILDKEGAIKLTDFNIALQLEAETTKTVAGKHAWIPPEQFRGESKPQSDIYGMGCTLHYLLTGQEPEALVESDPNTADPNLGNELSNLVKKCTAQGLANRYQNVNDVKTDLIKLKEAAK